MAKTHIIVVFGSYYDPDSTETSEQLHSYSRFSNAMPENEMTEPN